MVYLDGDNNLEEEAVKDFLEMAAQGSDANINIIVQFDRIPGYNDAYGNWTNCQRFFVSQGMTPSIGNAMSDWGDGQGGREVNMADPQTLEDFITWGAENYPADRYALILWNHGGGWRSSQANAPPLVKTVCWDDTASIDDGMDTREIQTALSNSLANGHGIDLIGFDACLMGTVEVAYELKDLSRVMVASEEVEPARGWPYLNILSVLGLSPDASPIELGEMIVNAYGIDSGSNSSNTLSAIDLTGLGEIADAVADLSLALQTGSTITEVSNVLKNVCRFDERSLIDLYDFADRLLEDNMDDAVQSAVSDVKLAMDNSVTAEFHGDWRSCAHGMSIYFPEAGQFDEDYNEAVIDFPGATQWDEFLFWYFEETIASVALVSPENGTVLDQTTLPHFSWQVEGDAQLSFKLQFSPRSNFRRAYTLPQNRWMEELSTENIPQSFWEQVWQNRIQPMAQNSDKVYWRVVAKNPGQAGALISDVRTFTVSSESDTLTNSLGMTFKLIESGTFMMGSPADEAGRYDNEVQHEVTISQAYYMQTTEVTQAQWNTLMEDNPSYFTQCGDNCPVEQVSWESVQTFIGLLNEFGEGTYALPTEAEWEYAARGGSSQAFANGDISQTDCGFDSALDAVGWYCGNSQISYSECVDLSGMGGSDCAGPHETALKQPNAFGLYDMHGNVWEWCQDWYDESYEGGVSVTDPQGPFSGNRRVMRGGGWEANARGCRSANRSDKTPGYAGAGLGFRLKRILP